MRSAPIFLTLIGSVFGYDLVTSYSGPTFFAGWDYYGHWDNLTNGISCALLMTCRLADLVPHRGRQLR